MCQRNRVCEIGRPSDQLISEAKPEPRLGQVALRQIGRPSDQLILLAANPSLAHSAFWIESARRTARSECELPELFSQPLRPVQKVIHSNSAC